MRPPMPPEASAPTAAIASFATVCDQGWNRELIARPVPAWNSLARRSGPIRAPSSAAHLPLSRLQDKEQFVAVWRAALAVAPSLDGVTALTHSESVRAWQSAASAGMQ